MQQEAFITALLEAKGQMLTIAEKLRQEGEDRGRQMGRREVLREQLEAKFGELSQSASQSLEQADEATLKRYSLRLLTAESVEQVLG